MNMQCQSANPTPRCAYLEFIDQSLESSHILNHFVVIICSTSKDTDENVDRSMRRGTTHTCALAHKKDDWQDSLVVASKRDTERWKSFVIPLVNNTHHKSTSLHANNNMPGEFLLCSWVKLRDWLGWLELDAIDFLHTGRMLICFVGEDVKHKTPGRGLLFLDMAAAQVPRRMSCFDLDITDSRWPDW